MSVMEDFFCISERLEKIRTEGLYRTCQVVEHRGSRTITVSGREYLNFTSNDYMGLAASDFLREALKKGADVYGCGTGASPLVTGLTEAHDAFAQKLKSITQKEAVLLFSSGFAANQAIVKALHSLGADLIFDRYAHASMQDAASYIGKFRRFPHCSTARAATLIDSSLHPVILTEGVFSMDGDSADLLGFAHLREQGKRFLLVLDDAHGFGVLGPHGHGTLAESGLPMDTADIYMGTLSKAVGVQGAFVACSRDFAEYMVNTSREYIYSTSMPAALAYAAHQAVCYIEEHDELRVHLRELINQFQGALGKIVPSLVTTNASRTSIQPVVLGDTERTMKVAAFLREHGIWCGAMRPPTVPRGTSRLRLTITAAHTSQDVKQLADILSQGLQHAR